MPDPTVEGLIAPEGWSIEGVTKRRTIGEWVIDVLFLLPQFLIPRHVPDFPLTVVIYLMRRHADGKLYRAKFDVDHAPDALVEWARMIERIKSQV